MSNRLTLATVTLVAALIGLNFTVLKYALEHASPILLTGMRSTIAGAVLLSFALLRGEKLPRNPVDVRNIFIVGFSITTVSSALLLIGTKRVPAGVASLLGSTMPLFTAVLTLVLLRNKLSRQAAIGLAVGFVGTAVLASPSLRGSSQLVGVAALVASALAWAYGTVHMKWQDMSRVSPVMLVAIQLVFSAAILVPFALIVEGTADTELGWGLFVPLLYASIPAQALTFVLLATVVRRATPTQAASTAYLVPLFGVTFGALIRDERLGWIEFGGGFLVVVGVFIVVTATARSQARGRSQLRN
ncbi:MAG TPA: EamA family transporter [Ilumatobacter sp.]|nr:EamA family transporter [Ilumatobacter sp.]